MEKHSTDTPRTVLLKPLRQVVLRLERKCHFYPPRWNFRADILRGVAPQYIPLLNKASSTIVLLYLFIYLFFAEVGNIGSHTYWSWRSLTKRAGPKVMIIYKYQYEKECMLKKMHCYWCLNNCTVREMERGERMGIIFSRCVLWGGVGGSGGGVLNRTHPTRCKQRSQGRDKNSTFSVAPPSVWTKLQTNNQAARAVFFSASRIICCDSSLLE